GRARTSHPVQGRTVALTSYLGVTGPSVLAWSVHLPPEGAGRPEPPGVFGGTNLYDWSLQDRSATVSWPGTRLEDITDGTGNTLLVGERPPSATLDYGWWFARLGQAGAWLRD